ncbi:MAG TPA: TonB-dependent receptor [Cellvibrionaceae bacterium]
MNNIKHSASRPWTLSRLALAIGVASTAAPLLAQAQADVDPRESQMLEEILITGSRLTTPTGMNTPTPVAVLNAEDYELAGTQNIEQLLLDSPQFAGNQLEGPNANTVQAGQPIGVSTLNLRNFGASRNLVLVNGRRFAITGPGMTTDINTIPAALIERTEVVTGGSSAVYGSDAITGVVNFIMKEDFEGVALDVQSSWDMPTKTPTYNIDLTFGTNFDEDRGNITASLGYMDRNGFTTNERGGFVAQTLSDACVTLDSYSPDSPGTTLTVPSGETCNSAGGRMGFTTGGSGDVPNGRIGNLPLYGSAQSDPEFDLALANLGLQDMGSLGAIFDTEGNSLRPFISPDDRYDFANNAYIVTPQERWMANVFGKYDFTDSMTGYSEIHYSSNQTKVQIIPTNVGGNFLVDTDNPYLSGEMQNLLQLLDEREIGTTTIQQGSLSLSTEPNDGLAVMNYGRRFSDLPTRQADADHQVFRTVLGLRGDLGDVSDSVLRDLSYDVYYSFASTTEVDVQIGSVSRSRVQNAMLSQNGEAPLLNMFGNGNMSEAAIEQILIGAVSKIEAEQKVAVASLTGIAFDLPAGPVAFAIGAEWRDSSASYIPDSFLASGDVSGWNSARATSGRQSVQEVFGEVRLPVLAGITGAERLDITGAFRYSDYDVGSEEGVWTYSGGLEWAPVADLSLRTQFQHAIRAPNIGELFGGQGSDGPTATDPCGPNQPADQQTQAVRDVCVATGVPESAVFSTSVQPSPFLRQIRGGNPDLNPEESDTTTIGIVYQPSQVDGLALSIDYFNIKLDDAIAPLGGGGLQNVLDLCYNTLQDPDSVFCGAVNRDPNTGEITGPRYVYTTNANIGGIETSGVDLQANYSFDTDWGLFAGGSTWNVSTSWTYTDEFVVTPVQDLPNLKNDCLGAWGGTCGQPVPEWKSSTRLTAITGPMTLSLRARYMSDLITDRIAIPQSRGDEAPSADSFTKPTIGSYVYFDLTGQYAFSEDTEVTLGVRNIMDKEAPIVGSLEQGGRNTIPATYDMQGRVVFVKLSTKF